MDYLGRLADLELYYKHCERPMAIPGDVVRANVKGHVFVATIKRISDDRVTVERDNGMRCTIKEYEIEEVLDETESEV